MLHYHKYGNSSQHPKLPPVFARLYGHGAHFACGCATNRAVSNGEFARGSQVRVKLRIFPLESEKLSYGFPYVLKSISDISGKTHFQNEKVEQIKFQKSVIVIEVLGTFNAFKL